SESRQALGWSPLLQHRLRAVNGAGDVFDRRWANRSLETGEASGVSSSSAVGFRGESAYCRLVAVRDWRMEVARKSRIAARGLDRCHRGSKPLEPYSESVERLELLRETCRAGA